MTAIVLVAIAAVLTHQPVGGIQRPERAERILRDMAAYLEDLDTYAFTITATAEAFGRADVKMRSRYEVAIDRPDRFAFRHQEGMGGTVVSDGQTYTGYYPPAGEYGVATEPNITLSDFIEAEPSNWLTPGFAFQSPVATLVLSEEPLGLFDGELSAAEYVGLEEIRGVQTHHLIVPYKPIEEQRVELWVAAGDQPYPVRAVLRLAKADEGQEQPDDRAVAILTSEITNWRAPEALPADAFIFEPPPGARRVDKKPRATAPASERGK